jgi:hypothetical protein
MADQLNPLGAVQVATSNPQGYVLQFVKFAAIASAINSALDVLMVGNTLRNKLPTALQPYLMGITYGIKDALVYQTLSYS